MKGEIKLRCCVIALTPGTLNLRGTVLKKVHNKNKKNMKDEKEKDKDI